MALTGPTIVLLSVTAVAGVAVVGLEFTPPGLHVGTMLAKVMNASSAERSKSAPAPGGLGMLIAVSKIDRGLVTTTHLPSDMVLDVSEYAVKTSYAVGDVLKR